jgi:hypothetical protein
MSTLTDIDLQRVRDTIEKDQGKPHIKDILAKSAPYSATTIARFRNALGYVPLARDDGMSRARTVGALRDGSLKQALNGSIDDTSAAKQADIRKTTRQIAPLPDEPTPSRSKVQPIEFPIEIPVADDIDRLEWEKPTANLSDEFWNARPVLVAIRHAAYSRMLSADALLGAVLARIAAGVPHQVRIPAIVGTSAPLSLIVNLIGASGAGKSVANGTAIDLLPLGPQVIDQAPIGSGEGLVEMLFDMEETENAKGKPIKVKVQKYRNACVYIDEGEALVSLAQRKDAIVLATLRTIYSGGVLGQTNASQETKRHVPRGEHTFGIVIAIQETVAAALLEHEADGTPQRFLWLSAIDPSVPDPDENEVEPEWPGEMSVLNFLAQHEPTGDWDKDTVDKVKGGPAVGYMQVGKPYFLEVDETIRREVRKARLATVHGDGTVDPIRAHENLTRLKVAGCLAILDQRVDINPEDWRLAGLVMGTSTMVLARTRQIIHEEEARKDAKTSQRAARRQVAVADALDERTAHLQRVAACTSQIRNRVEARPGTTVTDVRRTISKRLRDVFDEALARAIKQGIIEERSEQGAQPRGGSEAKRALYPAGETEAEA